jgi:pimeloyl-ACP methyl ester carboxylesterase
VKAGNWLTHLELDWETPVWSPLLRDLARTFRFIRYDERGCGLSDWEVPEVSFETLVSDLERVVDAAGLERFALLGISHGAAVSIEYAARHPERVSHLVLFGGYAAGWRHTATVEEVEAHEAIMVVTEAGWGSESLDYQGFISRSFIPDGNIEELRWLDGFQRRASSPRNVLRLLEALSRIDVRERLQEVNAPTLVIHSRGDRRVPVAAGHELATGIANAEFLGLDSNNHLLLAREPASNEFVQAVRRFIAHA